PLVGLAELPLRFGDRRAGTTAHTGRWCEVAAAAAAAAARAARRARSGLGGGGFVGRLLRLRLLHQRGELTLGLRQQLLLLGRGRRGGGALVVERLLLGLDLGLG